MNKLDQWLTDTVDAFMTILKWFLIIGSICVVIDQICIALANSL